MGRRIVIVDDAAFIREVLQHLLTKAGYEVAGEACDGEEAVTLVKEIQPDLVIMDLVMPKKSGIQATEELISALPKLKVIACSTEGSEMMVMRALEAGCCDYITKPFAAQQVLDVVARVVEKGG
jgi:two-component system chemotaxis response regulator CheY